MREVLQLALMAAEALTMAQPPRMRARPCSVAVLVVAATICLLVAGGFVLTASWLFLLPWLGPVGTPLMLAAVLLLKAAACLLWLRFGLARPAPKAAIPAAQFAPLMAAAERLFAAHKSSALGAALLAGLVAGARRN